MNADPKPWSDRVGTVLWCTFLFLDCPQLSGVIYSRYNWGKIGRVSCKENCKQTVRGTHRQLLDLDRMDLNFFLDPDPAQNERADK